MQFKVRLLGLKYSPELEKSGIKLDRNISIFYEKEPITDKQIEPNAEGWELSWGVLKYKGFAYYIQAEYYNFIENLKEKLFEKVEKETGHRPVSVKSIHLDERYNLNDYYELTENKPFNENINEELFDYHLVMLKDNSLINITEEIGDTEFEVPTEPFGFKKPKKRMLLDSIYKYFKDNENEYHIYFEGVNKNAKIIQNMFGDTIIKYILNGIEKECYLRTISCQKLKKLAKELKKSSNKLDTFRLNTRTCILVYFHEYMNYAKYCNDDLWFVHSLRKEDYKGRN